MPVKMSYPQGIFPHPPFTLIAPHPSSPWPDLHSMRAGLCLAHSPWYPSPVLSMLPGTQQVLDKYIHTYTNKRTLQSNTFLGEYSFFLLKEADL